MKWRVRLGLLSIIPALIGLLTLTALAQQPVNPPKPSFSGKVISVADGDTVTVDRNGQKYRIRLSGIDAPESFQNFGIKSKQALEDKLLGKEVAIRWKGRDKYNRIVGNVSLGDRNLNQEMVREGMAWHYTKYSKDANLATAEKEAKDAKRGLWSESNAIAPWDYRKGDHEELIPLNDATMVTVYVTNAGEKYHRDGCHSLAKSRLPTTLAAALSNHYGACLICQPPVIGSNGEIVDDPPAIFAEHARAERATASSDESCLPLTIGTGLFLVGFFVVMAARSK